MPGGVLQWNYNSKHAHEIQWIWDTRFKGSSVVRRGLGGETSGFSVVRVSQAEQLALNTHTHTVHSHHLRPGHRVLVRVVVWIPVTKTVHVIVWVHWGSFVRHGNLPKLGQPGRARGDGAGAVEMFSLWSAAMLHDLFILGALILKPYFHLKKREGKCT